MPLAAPLLIPFAEAVGLSIAGLGAIEIGKKVQDFISDNPEISMEILTTLVPGNMGLNTLFKDDDTPSTKDIVLGELGKEKGNYSDPDAEGAYSSKRGRIIKALEKAGKIKKGPDKDYDASKKYKDYKKFYEKANGGAIGIEVLFEEKKDGGRIGFANGGDNIIGADLKDEGKGVLGKADTRFNPIDLVPGLGQHIQDLEGIKQTTRGPEYFRESTNNMIQNLSDAYGKAPVVGGINQALIEMTAAPLSGFATIPYEAYSAYDRMEPGSGFKGYREALAKENMGTSMVNRFVGAAQPLANRIQSGNFPLSLTNIMDMGRNVLDMGKMATGAIGDFFFTPAGAADFQGGEMLQAPTRTNVQGRDLEADLGTRINPNIQPQQNIFQRAGNVFSSIKDNIPNFGIMGLLSSLDRFDTLSPEDQAFILDQAGGNRPSKDRYGINRRSAFGNYAQYVRDKGIFAPGKRGEYYRSISGLDQALMDTLDREQKAKAAYEKQIRDAADAASRNAARARSITAGYGGSDDSRGATGPTASGAGMGVGGGYASDYFGAYGGSVPTGLATMFVEKR